MCYAEGKVQSFDMAKGFVSNIQKQHMFYCKKSPILQLYQSKRSKCRSNFDSWGGMLSPVDYQEFSWKYINQIIEALADVTPVIVLEKDVGSL
jgi:uroporphyrinogen decarboxylase